MTVPSAQSRNDFVGAGATDTFSYTFRIFQDTDLQVTEKDTNNVETLLVLTTDYTVTGAGDLSGGSITLTAGNLTTGHLLTIRRVIPETQLTDIRNQGPFFPSVHEDQFDRNVMILQQHRDELDRAYKLPETEVGTALLTTLPDIDDRKSKAFIWDTNGRPAAGTLTTVGAPLGASYITTLAEATLTGERVLTGTADQIVVTDNGSGVGTVVLSTPQDIATTSSPTFAAMTLTGALGAASAAITGAVSANDLDIVSHIELGPTPSQTGAVRLSNQGQVSARDVGDTADISLVFLNSSDKVVVGENTNAVSLCLEGGTSFTIEFAQAFFEGLERADPAAPAANKGRFYFRDNGAGKTQLVVRFATGAVQVIATEP